MEQFNRQTTATSQGGTLRQVSVPDIFNGAEKKTRPASVTILKDLREVYTFVRDFSNLPIFMKHLTRVERLSPNTYRWTIESQNGKTSQWETEIIDDRADELIAWRTRPGSPFEMTGAFTFEAAPANRGTIVGLKMAYDTTLGKIAGVTEKLAGMLDKFEHGGDPDTEAAMNVSRLRAFLETGEVPTVEGQPNGKDGDKGAEDESTVLAG